jgi:hypothetical protein
MLFQQTSAPTGWTKQTTHNNKALRVVSGTASSGGTTAFTSVFTSRTPAGTVSVTNAAVTLTESQIPSHQHQAGGNSGGGGRNDLFFAPTATTSFIVSGQTGSASRNVYTNSTGGGTSHTHSNTATFSGSALDFAVQYVDLIIASKT